MKNDTPIQEFIDQCILISNTHPTITPFNIVSKNPLKESEEKRYLISPEDRTHWKSKGLFYAILSDTASGFQESFKDVFTAEEFNELCKSVKESTKDIALSLLKDTIGKLKKRKYRLANPSNKTTHAAEPSIHAE
jgi:hypothetical protein